MNEFWLSAIAISALVFAFFFGSAVTITNIEGDCKAMHKFRNGPVVYSCEKQP